MARVHLKMSTAIEQLLHGAYSSISEPGATSPDTCFYYLEICEKEKILNTTEAYLVAKELIKRELPFREVMNYGYDVVRDQAIARILEMFPIEKRITLLQLFHRHLEAGHLTSTAKAISSRIDRAIITRLLKSKNPIFWIHGLIKLFTLNLWGLAIFFLCVYFLVAAILLPAPYDWMQCISFSYGNYSSLDFFNHLLNTAVILLNIGTGSKIEPINAGGTLLLISGKLASILIIGKYIASGLDAKLNSN